MDGEGVLPRLAREYLTALRHGDRRKASKLILDAVNKQNISVRDVYLHVFQPALYEVGRLWQINHISVAEEHFITAATQLVMSQLYPYIFTPEKKDFVFVACSVSGELHEVGMRMVADFFEMEGWDTYYLGANTPVEAVVQAVADRRADVLGVSATMSFHLRAATQMIQAVRECSSCSKTKILVGGYCFSVSPDAWRKAGADGYAGNAMQALEMARQVLDMEPSQ